MRVGEITSRIGDAVKIRTFLNNSLQALVLNPLVLLFSLAAMFFWSWKLALLSLALLPLNAALYWAVNRLNRSGQRRTGVALRYMPTGSLFDRSLRPVHGQTGVPVDFAKRPLWLVKGRDLHGGNDVRRD